MTNSKVCSFSLQVAAPRPLLLFIDLLRAVIEKCAAVSVVLIASAPSLIAQVQPGQCACMLDFKKVDCSVNSFGRKRDSANAIEIWLGDDSVRFLGIRMSDPKNFGILTIGAGVLVNGRKGVIMQLRQVDPMANSTEVTILDSSGRRYAFCGGD